MNRDRIFFEKKDPVPPFEFNEQVVSVFDDMLERSVPLYRESILRQAQLAVHHYRPGSVIYDLGCSHGRLGFEICREFGDAPFAMTGIDSSEPMIRAYRSRLAGTPWERKVNLVLDRAETAAIQGASVVVINLTLQFIPPGVRDRVIRSVFQGLLPGGILILTEKVANPHPVLSCLELDVYARFKKENGYSELEISQKREALEGVLIPETLDAHRDRLERAGFTHCDVWLKWFNFASMISIK